ncbi:N-acetylglucosaminyldiphosphodolichol N-acetylglucosaminyltransferase catalytic subunit alg13 [Microbotryomycetes sp. JL221]|nr:N-acetylglucosaminyldiphosphodolichol N-acetylglucosaminyltransferase catalytic subunit alg13 [Microbotryomycetes sp. JL221]
MLAVLTVGSTEFTELVTSFLSSSTIWNSLHQLGVTHVLAQIGNSTLSQTSATCQWIPQLNDDPVTHQVEFDDDDHSQKLHVTVVKFQHDIEQQIARAHVVVSHAGAGSILSAVRPLNQDENKDVIHARDKILIIVPNSTLMDSHQSDLADEFDKQGWAVVVRNPSHLSQVLQQISNDYKLESTKSDINVKALHQTTAVPPFDKKKMMNILDETLGYI